MHGHVHCLVNHVLRVGVTASVIAALVASGAATAAPTAGGYPGDKPFSRPCFMVQSHWNAALDGPQALCPAPSAPEPETRTP